MRYIGVAAIAISFLFTQACASESATTSSKAAAPKTSAETNVDILMNKIKADKKLLVATNMDLTDAEAAQFWPLYDDYQKKLGQINQRMARTITDYADAYQQGPLSDSAASKLVEEALAVEEAEVALKQSHAEQLGRVLPETKAARYLQIENKIRSLLRLELAKQIPLVY